MTYQQIAIEKFGSASTLHVSDLAPRAPGDDEVAIDVAYSGVNFADIQMRLGFYPDAPKKPFVPGYEVSGIDHRGRQGRAATRGRRRSRRRHVLRRLRVARDDSGAPGVQAAAHRRSRGGRRPARQLLHRAARAVRDGARAQRRPRADRVRDRRRRRARDPDGAPCRRRGHGPHDEPAQEGLHREPRRERVHARRVPRRTSRCAATTSSSTRRGGAEINWQRARLGLTGRMVCLGISSGVKDGKRNFVRIATRRAPHAADQRAQAVRCEHRHLRAQRAARARRIRRGSRS